MHTNLDFLLSFPSPLSLEGGVRHKNPQIHSLQSTRYAVMYGFFLKFYTGEKFGTSLAPPPPAGHETRKRGFLEHQ